MPSWADFSQPLRLLGHLGWLPGRASISLLSESRGEGGKVSRCGLASPITGSSRSSGYVKEIVDPLGRHADAGRKSGVGAARRRRDPQREGFAPQRVEVIHDSGPAIYLGQVSAWPRHLVELEK